RTRARSASLRPMLGTGIWGHLRNALISGLAVLAAACGKGSGAEAASTGDAEAAPAGSAVGSAAAPAGAADTGPAPKPAAPHLQVTLKDLQLFHPYSADRSMPSIKDDGSVTTRDTRARYGIGLTVEATNETGELLRDAWFEGDVRFT